MRPAWALLLLSGAVLTSLLYAQDIRDSTVIAGDWPMYNRDSKATRYSPLTQITPANVSRLRPAWTFKVGKDQTSGGITGGSEYTPIVVGGLMYVLTADSAYALDADTGKQVWHYPVQGGVPSRRGMGYWNGTGTDPRVYFTSGRRLFALEARTGRPIAGFGDNGVLDIERQYNGTVTVFRDLLLVGTNAAPGAVRAFDARSGKKVWEFRSVPQPGEPGSETWENGSSKDATGAIAWAFSLTIDPARNTVYAVFDSPTPDYYGGERHGTNLYANSIVALEATTRQIQVALPDDAP